jgi:hypothetical protein
MHERTLRATEECFDAFFSYQTFGWCHNGWFAKRFAEKAMFSVGQNILPE